MSQQKIIPYLMFKGQAEQAMNHYLSVFKDGEVHFVQRYGDSQDTTEWSASAEDADKIIHASFSMSGQMFFCADNVQQNDTADTTTDKTQPGAISLAIHCESDEEIEHLYKELSDGGTILMPLQDTFWGAKYALFVDKYEVTWHVNYQKEQKCN